MNKDNWIKKNKEESHHVSILMQRIAELEKWEERWSKRCQRQQDRIVELEKQLELHKNAHHKCVEMMQAKQSEPVAWTWFSSEENTSPYTQMTGYTTECWSWNKPDESVKVDEGTLMPLYTTPQTKPLSDEEIIKIYNSIRSDKDMTWEEWCKEEIEFARAIEKEHGIK